MSVLNKLATMIPLEEIDPGTQQQLFDVLKIDALKSLAVMRDAHKGYDLPIGSVALLDGYISPSFVGYDIGCGMTNIDTGIPVAEVLPNEEAKAAVLKTLIATIPTGFTCRKETFRGYPEFKSAIRNSETSDRVNEKVVTQMGTLGGGNHFLEIGETRGGTVAITIHSGSRNAGHTIGGYYMKLGRLLPLSSDLGQAYLQDMNYALQFALDNRLEMLREACGILSVPLKKNYINENHNHAIVTADGVLHRKGATPADTGQLGVIPANMRDGVYITRGLGNAQYLSSAPHGCGRVMGRNEAKKKLQFSDFEKQMRGIHGVVGLGTLDEAPGAYKDINYVLDGTEGVVVDIVDFVKPLINLKG